MDSDGKTRSPKARDGGSSASLPLTIPWFGYAVSTAPVKGGVDAIASSVVQHLASLLGAKGNGFARD
jgi:hypothetical protein